MGKHQFTPSQILSKSQPDISDTYVNVPLSNLSVAYGQDDTRFVADKVFPVIPVPQKSGIYFEYAKGYQWRGLAAKRAPNAESQGLGYNVETKTYLADVWANHVDISDQERGTSSLNPEQDATSVCMSDMLVARENEWAGKYFATSKWTGDQTGVSGVPGANQFLQWNDAGSNPIGDWIRLRKAILKRTGMIPNTLVFGASAWESISQHPDIIARVNQGQTTGPAMVTQQVVAALAQIPRVYVMESVKTTSKEGASDTFDFIGDKAALMVYSELSPGLRKASAGYTFAWTGYTGATEMGTRVSRMEVPLTRSTRIEMEMAFDMKLVAADLGTFFTAAVA